MPLLERGGGCILFLEPIDEPNLSCSPSLCPLLLGETINVIPSRTSSKGPPSSLCSILSRRKDGQGHHSDEEDGETQSYGHSSHHHHHHTTSYHNNDDEEDAGDLVSEGYIEEGGLIGLQVPLIP